MRPFHLSALLLLGASSPAFASTYAGASCVRESGGSLNVNEGGYIKNSGTTTLNVVCPMVADDVENTEDAKVWVVDLSSTESVCCEQRVRSIGAGGYSAGPQWCTGGAFLQTSAIDLNLGAPASLFTSDAHRYVYCSIPATTANGQSGLRTIILDE